MILVVNSRQATVSVHAVQQNSAFAKGFVSRHRVEDSKAFILVHNDTALLKEKGDRVSLVYAKSCMSTQLFVSCRGIGELQIPPNDATKWKPL